MEDYWVIFGPHPELVGHVGRDLWRVGSNDASNAHEESGRMISDAAGQKIPALTQTFHPKLPCISQVTSLLQLVLRHIGRW